MKRTLSIILAAAMAVSLAGCGGSGGSETTAAKAADTAAAAADASAAGGSGAGGSAAGADIPAPSSPVYLSLGSGSNGGNFYVVGGGIATVINNTLPDYFVITSEETGGSTANLTMIQNGDIEFGVTMTSSIKEAVEAGSDKVRGMIALYPSYLTIYSLADTDAHSLEDLNGRIVGLGSKGAAMDTVWRDIFEKRGIVPKDIFNDGHGATATAVSDGKVDVAVLYSLPPFAAIAELEATKDVNFIGLTDEEQQFLVDNYPFYTKATMPAGSYKGVTEDLAIVSEWNMLVTSSDVDADYVYLMTRSLMENNPSLMETYKGLSYATPENILNYNCPLHAGVVRYLEEVGIEIPAELIPAEYSK